MGKQLTISEINSYLNSQQEISENELEQLKLDKRTGVQKLLERYERNKEKQQKMRQKFNAMLTYEQTQYDLGNTMIAGIDEAGRGPLAGPVVAASVILHKDFYLPGLNDSKQLSKKAREAYYDIITNESIAYGVGLIHSSEIDQINIFNATKKAMKTSIHQLGILPDHVLIDAVQLDSLPCTSESIIKGDQKSISIAAASILAKVTRDRFMMELHNKYPQYNFASNMGYGTKEHMQALNEHGVTEYHRKSFSPVGELAKA
ncbi:ribonuclease HII [Aquibacillus koreensis]|uniref:Ribonuclease HII n=1 Tax=Aquibacillus koreensis TaxID=279446 RepID=A0A9X4AJC8_9BACI|nr:ribonuclease HII [Aquibacillus koreensis]MCT2534505.1 ribonuclease HII [Aquibacillus koreensis]MDC3421901.1 ribonuclease HII [Aquibacillus koreensis]